MNPGAMLALIAVLLMQPPGVWAGPEGVSTCPVSADFETPEKPFMNLSAAIKSGRPVEILVLGSASTVAHGEAGYPNFMLKALRAALPNVRFQLTVQGGRGVTAGAMLDQLRSALKHDPVPLVIWQTGTVEAVQGIHPEELEDVLEEGADLVTAHGGDIILVDSQFSRFLRANADIESYEQAMAATAMLPNVGLFHRFDLMHSWVHGGFLDLERTDVSEQPAAVVRLSQCIGAALARFVLNGLDRS
jgi:hypothetical protein